MSTLSLSFLGTPLVELDGVPVTIRYSKALALLIYLAVSGEPQRRDTVATLLWPDSAQNVARSSLRRELSLLNKALQGDWLVVERETIGLRSGVWLDVTQFQQDLTAYDASGLASLDTLSKAIDVYRGDFLTGFTLPDCPDYDEWQFFQTEGLRQRFATAVERLVSGLTNQHDFETAIPHARRWLSLDPLHEPAHQMLMRLYALSGRQAAALRQFSECQRLLQTELGVEPASETQELEIAIRERRLRPSDETPVVLTRIKGDDENKALSQAQVVESRPLFVGREPQLVNLDQALEHTLNGQGQIRFITGEAGAGKSALVAEFIRRSTTTQAELLITLGVCDAQTGAIDPYLPFREAFKALLVDSTETTLSSLAGSTLTSRSPQHLRAIASRALLEHGPQLLPVFFPATNVQTILINARRAGWQGEPPTPGNQNLEQSQVFEQVVAVLHAIAAQCPLILVLEDLHWADRGSIGILFRLARQLAGHGILVIGTYRPEAVRTDQQGDDHPLNKMAVELQRNLRDIHIDLEVARKEEGQFLVDGILDAEPNRLDTNFRQALYHQTGGHPLFVVELVQDLKKDGVLIEDEDGYWVMGTNLDWLSLPTRVEGAIAGRMAHLSAAQRWNLTIASVMGESFLAEVVAHVAGEDTREIIHLLSRTLQAEHRLVEAEGIERLGKQRLTQYRFRHNLMQVYLYERLDDIQRVYLHEDVARTLEALYAGDIERIALPLAHHFEMAGMTHKAVDYLQIIGASAARLGANLESIQHFSHALSLLSDLPEDTEWKQQALQLQFALGQALESINSAGSDTFAVYTQALALARELDDTRKIVQALVALTNIARNRSELDLAQAYGKECLSLAEESQDPELLMRTNLALFYLALGSGQCLDAASHMEQAISFYRNHRTNLSADDAYNFSLNLGLAGLVLAPAGFPDRALQYAQEGLALIKQHKHHLGIASATGLLSIVHARRGEYGDALRLGEAMIEISKAHNLLSTQTFGELHKGTALALLGQPDEGIQWVRQAIAQREAMNMHFAHFDDLARTGLGYGLVGQVETGLAIVNEAIDSLEKHNDRQAESLIRRIKGDLLLMQNLPEDERAIAQPEAETCFRQAIKIARNQQAKLWEARALASLCRLLHSQGRDEGCRQQLTELYDWFTEGFEIEDLRMVREVLQEI